MEKKMDNEIETAIIWRILGTNIPHILNLRGFPLRSMDCAKLPRGTPMSTLHGPLVTLILTVPHISFWV